MLIIVGAKKKGLHEAILGAKSTQTLSQKNVEREAKMANKRKKKKTKNTAPMSRQQRRQRRSQRRRENQQTAETPATTIAEEPKAPKVEVVEVEAAPASGRQPILSATTEEALGSELVAEPAVAKPEVPATKTAANEKISRTPPRRREAEGRNGLTWIGQAVAGMALLGGAGYTIVSFNEAPNVDVRQATTRIQPLSSTKAPTPTAIATETPEEVLPPMGPPPPPPAEMELTSEEVAGAICLLREDKTAQVAAPKKATAVETQKWRDTKATLAITKSATDRAAGQIQADATLVQGAETALRSGLIPASQTPGEITALRSALRLCSGRADFSSVGNLRMHAASCAAKHAAQ